jgi:hypothetical protein
MMIERFEMTSSIAKNCADLGLGGKPTSGDFMNCMWEVAPGFLLFLEERECTVHVTEGPNDFFGFICYHNPTDSATIFSS